MCEFCVQHGDGKKWYLEASNYAFDLSSDLKRREYVVDFVQGFSKRMPGNVRLLEVVKSSPRPVQRAFRALTLPHQKRFHYGQPVPIEECEQIFDFATSIVQVPCVCRDFAGVPEEGYCIAMTITPQDEVLAEAFSAFANGPDTSALQRLTREEASAVLQRCEDEGLMHSVWTFGTPFITAICNCNLSAGCMAMRTTLEFGHKTMWKGEYVARMDAETCRSCKACVERCPFSAISWDADRRLAVIDPHACYGCGICRSACRFDAISLEERTADPVLATDW